ncbi:TPA: transferrin-binding protein-like solute binding protein [Neisseria meningitidis]|uniref:transferrin-binding protein-like solute binding protein n=2 Tax=Neisseria meningitidis TaxID=487 RepID=UPI002F31BF09
MTIPFKPSLLAMASILALSACISGGGGTPVVKSSETPSNKVTPPADTVSPAPGADTAGTASGGDGGESKTEIPPKDMQGEGETAQAGADGGVQNDAPQHVETSTESTSEGTVESESTPKEAGEEIKPAPKEDTSEGKEAKETEETVENIEETTDTTGNTSNNSSTDATTDGNSNDSTSNEEKPQADEPAVGNQDSEKSLEKETEAPLETAKEENSKTINEAANSRLEGIDKVDDESKKSELKNEVNRLKEEGLKAIQNAQTNDEAAEKADEYQEKIYAVEIPNEEVSKPNYSKEGLTNGRNEGTTIGNGSTSIGYGSGEDTDAPKNAESLDGTEGNAVSEGTGMPANPSSENAEHTEVATNTEGANPQAEAEDSKDAGQDGMQADEASGRQDAEEGLQGDAPAAHSPQAQDQQPQNAADNQPKTGVFGEKYFDGTGDVTTLVINGETIDLKEAGETVSRNHPGLMSDFDKVMVSQGQYQHLIYGAAKLQDGTYTLFVQGKPTEAPLEGKAKYQGKVLHFVGKYKNDWFNNSAYKAAGTFTANVDFSLKTLTGKIDTKDPSGMGMQEFTASIDGSGFQGKWKSDNVEGDISGRFYGQYGAEMAGRYDYKDRDNRKDGFGVFAGKKEANAR